MKNRTISVLIASIFLFTGCGNNDIILSNYNNFVDCINNGDYATAYNYIDTSISGFLNVDNFEESLYYIDDMFYKADKVKKADDTYNFISGDYSKSYSITSDNKIIIPEIIESLDLYVPTGSSCMYNNIPLDASMITSSNEVETVYTINAPLAPGLLHIDTEIFGSIERTVDPCIGDTNTFTISNDITNEISNAILIKINNINSALESRNTDIIKSNIQDCISDDTVVNNYIQDFIDNRKLDDTFTSYHNPVYTVTSISCDLETSTSVKVNANFKVEWQVGEGTLSSMDTKGSFLVNKDNGNWEVSSISDWSFMYLTVLGDNK